MHLMRVRMAKGATILGSLAVRLGEAGVDITRLQTLRKDESHVVYDLLLDVPSGQSLELVLQRCQELEGVEVEHMVRHPAGADLHQDLELVQRLAGADPELAPQVLATAAPLLCRGSWAAIVSLPDRVLFATPRAPLLCPADLDRLTGFAQTRAVELAAGCPPGAGRTQLAVIALPPDRSLLVARAGHEPFGAAELARLEHLAWLAVRPGDPAASPLPEFPHAAGAGGGPV